MATDPDNENSLTLTSKILLRHAANKSKAKSWLLASSDPDPSLSSGTEEQKTTSHPSSSVSQETDADQDLANLKYDDENSGIGSVKKSLDDDNLGTNSNRQLLSANEALRRRLLSRDAYKRYTSQSQGDARTAASMARLSTAKKKGLDDDDDDGEEIKGKGRSDSRGSQKQQRQKLKSNTAPSEHENDAVLVQPTSTTSIGPTASADEPSDSTKMAPTNKKRPGSYLDQLLSQRQQKSRKKTKVNGIDG